MVSIAHRTADFTDSKDNYLLDLCQTIPADFLVTGDKALLALKLYSQTQIVTYREFCEILGLK